MHGAPAELLAAEPPQVFGAQVAALGEAFEGPRFREPGGHKLPEVSEAVVGVPRPCKPEHVRVEDLDPVTHRGRRHLALNLGVQSLHRGPERRGIKFCECG